jgi:transposase
MAEMRNWRIQASQEEIVASLTGNCRPELLFTLKQEMERYDFCQRQIAECDQEIKQHLDTLPARRRETDPAVQPVGPPKKNKKAQGNSPQFALDKELQRITGVDFTRIDGINVMTAQTIISEVGLDMSRWKTEAHFASWLGLCPYNAISGGKVLRRGTRKVVNRAATAFRIAGSTLRRSDSYLGAQFRRFRSWAMAVIGDATTLWCIKNDEDSRRRNVGRMVNKLIGRWGRSKPLAKTHAARP